MEHQPRLEDQLRLLEATIEEEDNEEMKSLVERVLVEEGLEEAVTIVISSWGDKQRARAQQEVDARAGPYWKVCSATIQPYSYCMVGSLFHCSSTCVLTLT